MRHSSFRTPRATDLIFCGGVTPTGRGAELFGARCTGGKSRVGEPAPMALCDIHVAGCGEHLPAWGRWDVRIPGTDQAVRGGRHGQTLHSGCPPRGRGMPAAVRRPACHSRRFKGERPIGTATGQQSQPPRPCANPPPLTNSDGHAMCRGVWHICVATAWRRGDMGGGSHPTRKHACTGIVETWTCGGEGHA